MKKVLCSILLVVVLSVLTILLVGCHGMGETPEERSADHARQLRLNGSMIVDDIDAILQMDRPSRLTNETVR